MKINFAQVPAQDVDTFGDEGLFGPDTGGNFYYNYVEFGTNPGGTEEVTITDGCGRIMPIAVDNIPELINVLSRLHTIAQSLKAAEQIQEYVNSDAQAYTTEDHIEFEPIQNFDCWPWSN